MALVALMAVASAQTGKGPAGGTGDPNPEPAPPGNAAPPPRSSPPPKGPPGGTADPSPVIRPPSTPNPPPVPPHEQAAVPDPAEDRIWVSLEEGLSARTGRGTFSIRLGFQSQFRFEASNSSDETRDASFVMRQARPQVRGNVGLPWIRYFIQPELAGGNARLLDIELDARPVNAIGLRVGQFVTPFSRTFLTPVPRLQFPDFSVANDYFRTDRDTGAMLYGTPFGDRFEYYAAVFNGNGINKGANDDKKMLYEGRLVVNPLGRFDYDEVPALAARRPFGFSLGVNAYRAEQARTTTVADKTVVTGDTDRNTTVGAELVLRWSRLAMQAEVYWRKGTDKNGDYKARGGYAQASVMVIDRRLELAGRFSLLDPRTSIADDVLRTAEGLLTFYASGQHLKLQARYTNAHLGASGSVFPQGTGSATVVRPDQTVHSVTLQTQLFF